VKRSLTIAFLLLALLTRTVVVAVTDDFQSGIEAYNAGRYQDAVKEFRTVASRQLSSGALLNLGNAQWKCGRTGDAIIAWEQSLWLNPFDHAAANNLRFARETAQLEAPELTWYEITSGWLPMNWWAWITGFSLWLAVGALVLPGVLRWRRATWPQAVAALGFGLFLLCLPAHLGTVTRINLGFVLEKETALRLTPTADGEIVTRLASGDPIRQMRTRGKYVLIRTHNSIGWVRADQIGLIRSR
jgi:tetratricopeptide (TPR) repeat protein